MTETPRCATPHCACGRCYSPGSVVGDWLAARGRAVWRRLRPSRFAYDERGAVRLPDWVPAMWDGDLARD